MEFDFNRSTDPSVFTFDVLPLEIQSRILGLLPITTLLICKAVSPSWCSVIRSLAFNDSYHPISDPIFLLFSDQSPIRSASAYLPSLDRWFRFPFPEPLTTSIDSAPVDGRRFHFPNLAPVTTGFASNVARTLIFSDYDHTERYAIINPFSPNGPLDLLPSVLDPDPKHWHKALALVQDSPSDYTLVVVVSCRDGVITRTYDSRRGRWKTCGHIPIPAGSVGLEAAVWHEGLLYWLNFFQNHFLTFDLVSGEWTILDVDLPMFSSFRHLPSFGGDLYLTAPTMHGTPSQDGISIWKLDQSAMIWREFDFKPSELIINGWFVVDCMGIISYSGYCSNKVLMCDLGEKRWWYSESTTVPSDMSPWQWVGRTIEPPINLLK